MYIRRISFSNNDEYPIIFRNEIPEYYSLKYIVINLKNKSYRVKYNFCRYYILFHEYFEIELNQNLLENFYNSDYKLLNTKNMQNFTYWLSSNCNSKINYNIALSCLNNFIMWYFNIKNINSSQLETIKNVFKFQSLKINKTNNYKSLNKSDLNKITSLTKPNNSNNPFIKKHQLRNYLIINILIDTGIRLSELLLLKIDDFLRQNDSFYIRIEASDKKDIRINQPSLKNIYSERTIGISIKTYILFDEYVKFFRYKKKIKKNHFVFQSNQSKPLSISSVHSIIKIISTKTKVEFTTHTLRHFFCESMLNFLLINKGLDMERAKDELRMICGWSLNS